MASFLQKMDRSWLLYLGVLAGFLYNVWPIGFVINNRITSNGLTSDLQASGQPYSWLFVLGDVFAGSVVILFVVTIIRLLTYKSIAKNILITGLLMFGVFTMLSALIPPNCGREVLACDADASQMLGVHNILTVVASIGIVTVLFACGLLVRGHALGDHYKFSTLVISVVMTVCGVYFLTSYFMADKDAVSAEQLFLVCSGITLGLAGLITSRAEQKQRY